MNNVWIHSLHPIERDAEFIREFRVSYPTFLHLVQELRPYIEKQNTNWRPSIDVEQRVAVALHRIAHGSTYDQIASHLGVGSTTAQEICEETFAAICRHMWHKVIRWPDARELHDIMSHFEEHNGFPMCAGAIDGCHIPITAPRSEQSPQDYHNRKGFFSIHLQGTCDCNGQFIDVAVGAPGRCNDPGVYTDTKLGKVLRGQHPTTSTSDYFPEFMGKVVSGVRIRPYIIGDNIYTLEEHCQRGFKGAPQTLQHAYYCERLSSTRQVIECAFGRLKGRFRILQFPTQFWGVLTVTNMVIACCVVHNICERAGDFYSKSWERSWTDNVVWAQFYELQDSDASGIRQHSTHVGKMVQEALLQHVAHPDRMPADWQPSGNRQHRSNI